MPSTFVSAISWKFSQVQPKSQKRRREVSRDGFAKQTLMKAASERDIARLLQVRKKWILRRSIQMHEVFIRFNKGVRTNLTEEKLKDKRDANKTFNNL